MPRSFFWMFALLAALFFILRRFLRRSTTLTDYKMQQEALLKKRKQEELPLSDEEALMPVLAALRDVPLPPHMEMRRHMGHMGATVHIVTGKTLLLAMTLTYSRMAPPSREDSRKFPNGAWHLRLDYHAKSGQGVVTHDKLASASVSATDAVIFTTQEANECFDEYFDELAPFATRVENLIRSLHDSPF